MMFLSTADIETSLSQLTKLHPFFGVSYLAFKRLRIPVGSEQDDVPIAQEERALLDRYYSPAPNYDGYYIPFRGAARKHPWVNRRYPDTTLQRIRTDTFNDALLHEKGTARWGWRPNYIEALRTHLKTRIPALDLAVWLYRDLDFPLNTEASDLVDRLIDEFAMSKKDCSLLSSANGRALTWNDHALSWLELRDVIGPPPGAPAEEGATLGYLALRGVGPARTVELTPGQRLTIITGDNGLGKSFLLECAWFALTGSWSEAPAHPLVDRSISEATIEYKLGTVGGAGETHVARYNWTTQEWSQVTERRIIPGVVFFARADGSFSIWDPAKQEVDRTLGRTCFLTRNDVWEGKRTESTTGRQQVLCGGLIADWTLWESAPGRYPYEAFCAAVRRLSPPELEPPVEPGAPARLPDDVRDIPTLRHPYGEVPIVYASAGIKRIVTMAYLLVWTWFEHRRAAELQKRSPQERLVVLIDEVEAHLHPRWQRTIIPALMEAIGIISSAVQVQLVIATHSPLVLASIETLFDFDADKLFHLDLNGSTVRLAELPFVKYGDVDKWLQSGVFGLRHARSLDAENAIEAAKSLQLQENPSIELVAATHRRLERVLSADDDFWPRWRYFAGSRGVPS
jgi:hypothetical protein